MTIRLLLRIAVLSMLLPNLLAQGQSAAQPGTCANPLTWGRIANEPYQGQRVLSALFFAGPPNPRTIPLYTRHPKDADQLDWSSDADVDFALDQMRSVGLNTIKLSYWGQNGETDSWSPALMFSQRHWEAGDDILANLPDTQPHGKFYYSEAQQVFLAQHFFQQAAAKDLLIAPLIEVSPAFPFYRDFPENLDKLVERSVWLLSHFGDEPNYLQMIDQTGKPRHVIWLIETIHISQVNLATFANGFDKAAELIEAQTGYPVGFILDPTPLPAYGVDEGPDPDALRGKNSVLAINPFNITSQGIELHDNQDDITEEERLAYAESVMQLWGSSGIPFIAPIIPGYDASRVFPDNGHYGFNEDWRQRQLELAVTYENAGLSIDIWNGWSEGHGIPPTIEDGDVHMKWVSDVTEHLNTKWNCPTS